MARRLGSRRRSRGDRELGACARGAVHEQREGAAGGDDSGVSVSAGHGQRLDDDRGAKVARSGCATVMRTAERGARSDQLVDEAEVVDRGLDAVEDEQGRRVGDRAGDRLREMLRLAAADLEARGDRGASPPSRDGVAERDPGDATREAHPLHDPGDLDRETRLADTAETGQGDDARRAADEPSARPGTRSCGPNQAVSTAGGRASGHAAGLDEVTGEDIGSTEDTWNAAIGAAACGSRSGRAAGAVSRPARRARGRTPGTGSACRGSGCRHGRAGDTVRRVGGSPVSRRGSSRSAAVAFE